MESKSFIITLTGPSQSGKSLLMSKIQRLGAALREQGEFFYPEIIRKYTTRHLRWDEERMLEKGKRADVEHVKNIPEECDVVYQTYGVRYGIQTRILSEKLEQGYSPVIILNDIRVVEEIRKFFSGKVLSLFLFRKVPQLEDFKKEAQNRGNISETEVVARYEKAVAIYRTYIENIILFDNVVLNSVEYESGEEQTDDTILDLQLENIIFPILQGKKKLKEKMTYPKLSRIFVVAGNAASGKDEIIRALLSMGKLQARVLPKYTMRQQEPEDGCEMICRYVPGKECLLRLKQSYLEEKKQIEDNLTKIDVNFKKKYKEDFLCFCRQLEEKNPNEYERFWEMIRCKMDQEQEEQQVILNRYFETNPQYVDLLEIKKNFDIKWIEKDVGVYEKDKKRYLIYGNDTKLYGCDLSEVQEILDNNKYHLVIVASQIEVVNVLKELYGEQRVRLIYAHSEISAGEFEANATDITKKEKKEEFRKILDSYTKEISHYDHVTIYAKSQLTYEQTSKEEELIDQMFRLLRAY